MAAPDKKPKEAADTSTVKIATPATSPAVDSGGNTFSMTVGVAAPPATSQYISNISCSQACKTIRV